MANQRKNRDFSPITKRLLAERVAYICSRPLCRRLTIKPHSTEKKSTNLGEGGHIYGASRKGPRYDGIKPDKFIRSFDNGIWLCRQCHKLVDTEKSKYDSDTLLKWKEETENYVETLVIQDTRLRQLRIICQNYLSTLRRLSALPAKLDQTFDNPNGNGINMTRLFMELELILFENQFLEEADLIKVIALDFENPVCTFVNNNRTGNQVSISSWKNKAVNILMLKVMRFSLEAYQRYFNQENAMVNDELIRLRGIGLTPVTLNLTETAIGQKE